MEKFEQTKIYDLETSVVDEEKKCVRVLVNMKKSNWIDASIAIQIDRELEIRFPNLKGKFTGKWDTKLDEDTIKEYLFFYE